MEDFYLDLTQKTRQRGNHNNDENKRSAREIMLVGLASPLSIRALLHNINLPFDFLAKPLNPRAKWSNSRSMHSMQDLCLQALHDCVVPQCKLRDDTYMLPPVYTRTPPGFWGSSPKTILLVGLRHNPSKLLETYICYASSTIRHVLLSSSTIRSISPLWCLSFDLVNMVCSTIYSCTWFPGASHQVSFFLAFLVP
jgi:hypothetical protein